MVGEGLSGRNPASSLTSGEEKVGGARGCIGLPFSRFCGAGGVRGRGATITETPAARSLVGMG
jgi:hypothetical protein